MSSSNPGDLSVGIGDTPDAGVPDAGPGGETSDVHGVAINLQVTSPTTIAQVPQDLSAYVLQAYVADDAPGGFRIIDAEHNAGGFTIPAVPAGSFYLLAILPGDPVPHFFQTASRNLDLGFLRRGRVDGPLPVLPTNVTFNISGASAVQPGDRFLIDSFSTGGEAFPFAPTGATELNSVIDWRDTGAVLLNAASGDDLFVTHQRRTPGFLGQSQRTIVDAFSTRSVTLVDGENATVTGAFSVPAVTSNLQVQFNPASYIQGHDVPLHQPLSMLVRMRAGFTGASSQGTPLVDLTQTVNSSQQQAFGFVGFNDPYPSDWRRFVVAVLTTSWNYAARGTTQSTQYSSLTFSRTPASSFFNFTAPFPAPHGIRLGGVDASRSAAVPFDGTHPVTIEWQPIVGVTHYTVNAMQLTSDGIFAGLNAVATFDVLDTKAVMPASLFQVGGSYVFSVESIVDPTTDFAGGTLVRQGYPIAVHDAVTARLLFAGSCGNGVADAPFEQCDSGGVASETCNPDCTIPVCGDGYANVLAHESCDDAGDTMFCNANCTLAACGDGKVHFAAGEQCDDGNASSGDGCSPDCLIEPGFTCSGEPSACHF